MVENQSVSVYFSFGRFSIFQKEGYWDFQNLKSLTLITYKKQSNRATERVVEQIRTTEKENFQQYLFKNLHTDSNIKLKIFWISKKGPNRTLSLLHIEGA